MSSRSIENPGVEIKEIDRSQYDKVDYSLQNAPTVLTFGVATQGEDLALTWINSRATLNDTYGIPTNEYERYFYNSMFEVLRRGGTCIAAKLPYNNEAYRKYNYVQYDANAIKNLCCEALSDEFGQLSYNTIGEIHYALAGVLKAFNRTDEIDNVAQMHNVVQLLYTEYVDDQTQVGETIGNIKDSLEKIVNTAYKSSPFVALPFNDNYLTSAIGIKFDHSDKDSIEAIDSYLTNSRALPQGKIRIYDITRTQYASLNSYDGCVQTSSENTIKNTNDCLGIVPVIVTPANAMFFQNILNFGGSEISTTNYSDYNEVSGFTTVFHKGNIISTNFDDVDVHSVIPMASVPAISVDSTGYNYVSLSQIAASMFPTINFNGPSHFDNTYLKCIGVVVFKAYMDVDNNNKLNFELLESFIGSLSKNARDIVTNADMFIDNVINSKSQYIRFFSNVNQQKVETVATYIISKQKASSLGFYKVDCKKLISYEESIMKPLTSILSNAANKNSLPLDIVVDGGMSNIAQLAYVSENKTIDADKNPNVADVTWVLGESTMSAVGWRAILQKLDNFVKYDRKDCMFIADGVRSFCLDGNMKYVRKTKPENTVANTIIPKFRYMANALNSSYSAGYCNWFYAPDYSNNANTYLWVPPSIKVVGVYIYCNTYFHPWSAPAGQTRGIINDAIDVAFIPLDADAGQIYSNQWNYAMSYPIDGIVIEGHKTFQTQKTALDRINVRRLMLDLEKKVVRIARYFVYEGNTSFIRQSFVDAIRPIFEDAVAGDGVKEYAIKCDEELNTTQVIENNELRCKIAVKPVKCVDFIVVDIISTRQGTNVNEEVMR